MLVAASFGKVVVKVQRCNWFIYIYWIVFVALCGDVTLIGFSLSKSIQKLPRSFNFHYVFCALFITHRQAVAHEKEGQTNDNLVVEQL